MTKKEIYASLIVGGKIKKHKHMIFKRNKIVRGSTSGYALDGVKITERQFNEIYDQLSPVPETLFSVYAYQLTEYLDNKPF